MKIIQKREHVVVEYYMLCFDWDSTKEKGCGLAFDCDKDGNVDLEKLGSLAQENYHAAKSGMVDGRPIEKGRIEKFRHAYWEDSVGLCNSCKREVVLRGFTNTCECGIDYNQAGQQLADRSQWGEETGEHPSDCVGPFDGDDLDGGW